MGRRSVNTTKSGKFMNPTDQARKEARKKELKKNKKQRLLVRTAVLKNKDPGQIISELDKLDEIEYNPTQAPALAEKVLRDKRKKLNETLDRVMKLYQKEDPSYWSELRGIKQDYERRRFHRIQYFEAVKQAENTSVEDIPLPENIPGVAPPSGAGSSIADIPLPGEDGGEPPELHGILKKPTSYHAQVPVALPPPVPTFQGREPPGVPVGPPPDLSDIDDLSDDDDDEMEVETAITKPKSVSFQADVDGGKDDNKDLSEMDRFMKEIEEESKMFTSEEDLLPPGTEMEGDLSKKPKPVAASSDIPPPIEPMPPPEVPKIRPPIPPEAPSSIPAPVGMRPPPPAGAPPPGHHPPGPPVPPPQFFPPPPPALGLGGRMRFPPPPPMPMPMRPGYNMPPGRPPFGHGPRFRPSTRPSSVFSSAPQIIKSDTKIVSETMIQAKPQIRSLSADVTRFVPSIIQQKKDDGDKPKRHEYQIGQSQVTARSLQQHQARLPHQSKDDAYAEFMKEMSGLM